jgi:hypothetical protein
MLPVLLAALLSAPEVFTFDAHVHVINRQFYHGGTIGDRLPDGQFDLPRTRKGGVNALFFSLSSQRNTIQNTTRPNRHFV